MIKKSLMILVLVLVMPLAIAVTISDEASVFVDMKGGVTCAGDGSVWYDFSTSPPYEIPTTGPEGNCFINDSIDENKRCCPIDKNYLCQQLDPPQQDSRGRDVYVCIITEKRLCSDFKNKDDCEDASRGIAEATAENNSLFCGRTNYTEFATKICYDEIICTCEWDEDDEVCYGDETARNKCTDQPPTIDHHGTCRTTVTPDSSEWDTICSQQGYVEITASGVWDGDPEAPEAIACTTKDTTIMPCKSIVKLPFFSLFNLIITSIGLVLIYGLLIKRRKL